MPGPLGGLEDRLAGIGGAADVGREPALVADPGAEPALLEERLEMVVGLGADPQRLGERLGAGGDEHELLEVEGVVRVRAAVDHVHQRHGQHVRVRPTDPPVERNAGLTRRRLRNRQRGPEDGVRAEAGLRGRAVELDEQAVDSPLVVCVEADQRVGDLAVDVADRPRDALPEPGVAAVAELDRLVLAGRGAGRHQRHAERTGLEADLDLDGRVAPRVEHLPAVDVDDRSHVFLLFVGQKTIEGSWAP